MHACEDARMPTFQMKHEIECTPERFYKLFTDKEFNEALYKALEFPEWKMLDVKDTDKEIIRTVKATPKMEAPAVVVKALGSSFGYTEESKFDKGTNLQTFVIKPSTMADKLKNEGKVRIEAVGSDKCMRIVDITVEAKVFGIGGMIESSLEKSLRAGWEKSAGFTNKWVKEHP